MTEIAGLGGGGHLFSLKTLLYFLYDIVTVTIQFLYKLYWLQYKLYLRSNAVRSDGHQYMYCNQ